MFLSSGHNSLKDKTPSRKYSSHDINGKKVFNLYKGFYHARGYEFDREERFISVTIAKDFDAAVEKAYGPDFGRLKKDRDGRYIDIDGKTVYHLAQKLL